MALGNMNYNKMGIAWYVQDSQNKHITTNANPEDTDRYLFATEYVKPDSKIYDILCEYAGKDKLSYDEFEQKVGYYETLNTDWFDILINVLYFLIKILKEV